MFRAVKFVSNYLHAVLPINLTCLSSFKLSCVGFVLDSGSNELLDPT